MTAELMKRKKQLGPGSHKVKYDSKYHGEKTQMPATSDTPQLMMLDHFKTVARQTPGP